MMNRKKRAVSLTLALLLSLAALLTGCGRAPAAKEEPVNIAFVLSICDGEGRLDPELPELAQLSGRGGSTYAFIVPDGTPTVIADGQVPQLDEGYTEVMRQRLVAGIAADFQETLETYRPAAGEIDLGAALDLALRQLQSRAVGGRQNCLVLWGSGRSSEGVINMVQTPACRLNVQASAESVAKSLCADLSDLSSVVWYGVGECGGSQAPLSPQEKQTLRDFYQSLFQAMGLRSQIQFRERPTAAYYTFSQKVTPMPVQQTLSGLEALELAPEVYLPGATDREVVVRLDDDTVQFNPDEATFRDPQAAGQALLPFAAYLKDHPEQQLLLAGSTATAGTPEGCLQLSLQRAEAIRQLLTDQGVPTEQLVVLGLGQKPNPYREEDLDREGRLVEEAAALNRCVYLVLLPSETGRSLLEAAG